MFIVLRHYLDALPLVPLGPTGDHLEQMTAHKGARVPRAMPHPGATLVTAVGTLAVLVLVDVVPHLVVVRAFDVGLQITLLHERGHAVGTLVRPFTPMLLDVDLKSVLLVERFVAHVTPEWSLPCKVVTKFLYGT